MLGSTDAAKLEELRRELDAAAANYFRGNAMRQEYLSTRATKN
jgi:hypothetical protein